MEGACIVSITVPSFLHVSSVVIATSPPNMHHQLIVFQVRISTHRLVFCQLTTVVGHWIIEILRGNDALLLEG